MRGSFSGLFILFFVLSASQLVDAQSLNFQNPSGVSPKGQRTLVYLNEHSNVYSFVQGYLTKSNMGWNRFFDLSSAPKSKPVLKISNQLRHLNAVVFTGQSTNEFYDLKLSGSVEWIEPEFIRPLPGSVQRWIHRKNLRQQQQQLSARISSDSGAASSVIQVDPLQTSQIRPWGIQAVHAPEVWEKGFKGQGVKVLVLDTGVDKDHPVIKNRFRSGKNFITPDTNDFMDQPEIPGPGEATLESQAELPYEFYDNIGHGTHVAGTILAEQQPAGFAGVAPEAELYVGKICDLQGCSNVGEALGLDWGIENNIKVVNLSLGGQQSSRGEKMAIQKAERVGVVVVAASGNDGVSRVEFPAAYPTSIAVGAVDRSLKKAEFSQWGNELDIMAPGVEVMSSVPVGSAKVSKVFVSGLLNEVGPLEVSSKSFFDSPLVEKEMNLELEDFGVGFMSGQNLQNKVALIDRGVNTFEVMVKNAYRMGAKAALIVNNEPGLFEGSYNSDENSTKLSPIPVFMIEKKSGDKFRLSIKQGQKIQIQMKTFASDYDVYDGTSMATPHAVGVVALLLSAKPQLTPTQVREILNQSCEEIPGEQAFKVGHGFIQADKTLEKSKDIR